MSTLDDYTQPVEDDEDHDCDCDELPDAVPCWPCYRDHEADFGGDTE